MKVQKEIENVTRVPNRYPIEPLTMEDAVLFHKKVVDNYEKMRKDLNKKLGIGDIEEEGFTGRTDGKFSTPELKKMKLSESLFKESYTDEPTKDDIISWLFEHDQAWEDACTYFSSGNLEDVNYNDLLDWIFEHDTLSDDMMQHFGEESFINESLNEQLENTDGWPEEIGDELSGAFETLNNLQYEIKSCVRGAYTDCNTVEELVEYITDSAEFLIDRAEYLRDEADRLNEDIIDVGERVKQQEEEKARAEAEEKRKKEQEEETKRLIQQDEARAKAEKEREEKWAKEEAEKELEQRYRDNLWREKDWNAELKKADGDWDKVNFTGYDDTDIETIKDIYANQDERDKRAYERAKAKEEAEKQAKERQEKIEKAKQAIKSLPNNLKATANKAGINI